MRSATGRAHPTAFELGTSERRLIETRHGTMHLRTLGVPSDRSALVLLHMSPLSSRMFAAAAPRFARGRCVIVPDRLGFGASSRPPHKLSISEYADATADALDALGVMNADIVGIHTGSCEAIALALREPDRVRRVAIVSVPHFTDEERVHFKTMYSQPASPSADGSHLLAYWDWWQTVAVPAWGLELAQARVLDHLLAGPEVWWAYHAAFDYPIRDAIGEVRQPLLVLAPHDDLWTQTSNALEWLPPSVRVIELPNLSHEIFTLATAQIVGLLEGWFGSYDIAEGEMDG